MDVFWNDREGPISLTHCSTIMFPQKPVFLWMTILSDRVRTIVSAVNLKGISTAIINTKWSWSQWKIIWPFSASRPCKFCAFLSRVLSSDILCWHATPKQRIAWIVQCNLFVVCLKARGLVARVPLFPASTFLLSFCRWIRFKAMSFLILQCLAGLNYSFVINRCPVELL